MSTIIAPIPAVFDQDTDVNPTDMIHLTDRRVSRTVALCGAKLHGITHPDGTAECIVCVELDKTWDWS